MSTIPPPVTDAELDRPDIRAAALAVVDDVTTADVEPLDDRHLAEARRRPRLAIAAAAAAIAVGTGLAGYALAAGSDEPRAVTLDPSSAPGQAAPPAPAAVCEAVTDWLTGARPARGLQGPRASRGRRGPGRTPRRADDGHPVG